MSATYTHVPRRARRVRSDWTAAYGRLVSVVLILFFAKIPLYLTMGGAAFGARYTELQNGSTFERLASHLLWIDPLSERVINAITHGIF